MTDPALSMDPDVMDAQAAEVRAPVTPYVSRQIGCSDLAPLLVAWAVARVGSMWTPYPPRIRAWLDMAARRALRWSEKPVPAELRGMPAVWCAERARLVRTPIGPLPEIVATKAGLRERPERADYMQAGLDLEAALWDRWWSSEGGPDGCARAHYALAGVPASLRGRWSAPKCTHETAPLVTYPDGWGVTGYGEQAVINLKTTHAIKTEIDPPAWIQVQGEMEVMGADLAVLPHGQRWLADYLREPPEERPVEVFTVERSPAVGRELAAFATRAMEWINEVAEKAKKEGGA